MFGLGRNFLLVREKLIYLHVVYPQNLHTELTAPMDHEALCGRSVCYNARVHDSRRLINSLQKLSEGVVPVQCALVLLFFVRF